MNTYGERLEEALRIAGRERKELCAAVGITLQALGQVISGKTKALTAENSARAARFLQVDHFWLATGEGSPSNVITNQNSPFPGVSSKDWGSLPDEDKNELLMLLRSKLDRYALKSSAA
ncbi:helix-turn-helix domain-containing protein [Alcaligenes faecalis]|uniref:Helix-turn-helix domain-containing protein n=1 Tax=Alcaligenes faecalis TaxID=511 RepID=A0AAE9H8L7_ALCFA|nr:helix-turn-helix transcriptional regulator [Alcaligenes faecalis]UPL20219.1 helix-turn-helix domain-containing protein [Alcaligenes faecalis]